MTPKELARRHMPNDYGEGPRPSREANWFTYGKNWVELAILPEFDHDGMVVGGSTEYVWVINADD